MPKAENEKRGRLCNIIRPIVNSPALSERIGYLASEQRRAYNQCVEWLNREPRLKDMKSGGELVPRFRSLRGRISDLRDSKFPKHDPSWTCVPRWVHDAGAKLAHLAQQKFASDRETRLSEIRRIEDRRHKWAAKPPQSPSQWKDLISEERRYARLTRDKRRTLAFRTRKHGTQTLEVDNNQAFSVTLDRMSLWIGKERSGGFPIPLRRPLPKDAEVCSFRLVEKRRGRMGTANRPLSAVEYEAHIAVRYAETAPTVAPETLQDIVGIDVGVKKAWATSDGVFYHSNGGKTFSESEIVSFKKGPHACQCPPLPQREDGRRGRFRHQGRCAFARPKRLQDEIVAKPGGSARRETQKRRASKRRRKLERRRRELLRMRNADRDRIFTAHAQDLLDKRYNPVRMVAVEGLRRRNMMATARGGAKTHGENVRQKAGLNRSMSEAATGVTVAILTREANKRGIPIVTVDPKNSSRTCSKCGTVSKKSRKSQPRFECVACGWRGNADANAAVVLAFRAYQQWVDPAAVLGLSLSGGAGTALRPVSTPPFIAGAGARKGAKCNPG